VSWGGSTRRRHTFASMVLTRGADAVQVGRLLGHHGPAFTLSRYAHVPEGEAAAPLSLTEELGVVTVPDALPVAAWSR
jgi:integrase